MNEPSESPAEDHVIEIVRVFDAPRSLVWDCFTKAEHLARWWGPSGFSTRVERLELEVGGRTEYVMTGPDGSEYPVAGTFTEIVPGERFVTTDEFGEDYAPPEPGQLPDGMVVTAIFEDVGTRTRLTLRIAHPSVEDRRKHEDMGVVQGWNSSFDCLDQYLAESLGSDASDREIVISRIVDAPPERVFDAWATVEQAEKWWGPNGFTTTTKHADVRPGGEWRFTMHGPDGTDYENRIVFVEVARPERIVYRHDDDPDDSETPGIAFRTTVTFVPEGDGTKVTLRMVFPDGAARDRVVREVGAVEGGVEHLSRLAEHTTVGAGRRRLTLALPDERTMRIVREFDAPAEAVFEAFSNPEHVRRWWGCAAFDMPTCEIDFRPGGSWRFVQRSSVGEEFPFRGEYREIDRPHRLVQTFTYDVEGARDHPAVETYTFEERGGRTLLVNTLVHDSAESRDGHLHSGMESGARESLDRLETLLGEVG